MKKSLLIIDKSKSKREGHKLNYLNYFLMWSQISKNVVDTSFLINSELNINDFLQGPPHWKYRKIFKSFDKKKDLIKIGWNTLKKRFDGNNDLSYLKKNQYSPSYKSPKLVH